MINYCEHLFSIEEIERIKLEDWEPTHLPNVESTVICDPPNSDNWDDDFSKYTYYRSTTDERMCKMIWEFKYPWEQILADSDLEWYFK